MKTILKGTEQTIALDQVGIPNGKTIKLTIIGENGQALKDASEVPLTNIPLSYNTSLQKYNTSALNISPEEPEQYIRLFFSSSDTLIDGNYFPEDAKLNALPGSALSADVEIVPVQFFIDYVLSKNTKLDKAYISAVNEFVKDKNGIRTYLKAAQDDLEKKAELYFTERVKTEKRDNCFELFRRNMWQIQVYYPPINELVDVKIFYGNAEIAGIGKELFTFDKDMGLLEFLPVPGGESAGLYNMLMTNMNSIGLSVLMGGNLDRIPNFFQFSYKTGIFTPDADPIEKEGIRNAVSRRAYLSIVHHVDPGSRIASRTESLDGDSATISRNMQNVLKELKADEKEYVDSLRKKYGKTLNAVIV
jgi:hypothetical protein